MSREDRAVLGLARFLGGIILVTLAMIANQPAMELAGHVVYALGLFDLLALKMK